MNCIVCHGNNFKNHFKGLLKCNSCGHVVADMDLFQSQLDNLYAEDYFVNGEYFNYVEDKECFDLNFKKRLNDISTYVQGGELLEIGSAYGFFLNLAKDKFNGIGYELCTEAAEYAKQEFSLDIRNEDFLSDITLKANSFDSIVMWDVIEHLPNPERFTEKAYHLLKKGGVLAMSTGDIDSPVARLQKEKWRLIHPPTHLHYFSKQNLCRLLVQQGFKIEKVSYPGFWRSWDQIFFSLTGRHKSVLRNIMPGKGIYSNLYDIMQVIARK